MRVVEPTEWVVYKAAMIGKLGGHNATCSRQEWETMQANQAGQHTLIRDKIGTEAEAEQLARNLQTLPPVPKAPRKPTVRPPKLLPATAEPTAADAAAKNSG